MKKSFRVALFECMGGVRAVIEGTTNHDQYLSKQISSWFVIEVELDF
jgi:6,7-dimethyl-8-ribityllumazine synthase